MLRVSWKSAITLLAVAMFTVGAAQPEGCAGDSGSKDRYRLPPDPLATLSGNFFITGHAPDYYAVGDAGAARLLTKALTYVRAGSVLPFLWVESRIVPPAGHRSGKDGLLASGLLEGRDYVHMDAAQLAGQPATWWSGLSATCSAIVVASDRALLTQAELDQLDFHRGDIARFMRDNRGVLAFSESGTGAKLTTRDRFDFLPFDVFTTASATPPYSVTTFGHQALGLANDEVASPAYNRFDGTFGYNVITISDANGDYIAVAGRVPLADRYLFANAGVDGTFTGTGTKIPVILDGSASTADATSLPLRYRWYIGDTLIASSTEPIVTVNLLPGVYEITLELLNKRNEVDNDEVVVTVIRGSTKPTITCPASITSPTAPPGVCGAQVYFPPPTASAPAGIASLTCTQLTGSSFPSGVTPVTCTVVDKAGQSASCNFTITVRDEEAPSLVPPPPSISEADSSCHGSLPDAAAAAQAMDNCTPASGLVITQAPPAGAQVSGVGTYTIQLKATDAAGNSTTATTTHTVVDTTPPTIVRAVPSKQYLWPPNHKMVPITVGVVTADNCSSSSAVQCGVTHVTSNEPINGPGDGNTDWDWELTGPLGLNLRAERAGLLNDRIYTLWFECVDGSGATAVGTTTVTVPHDQRGR